MTRDTCAHCAVPRDQHGRRYAALPGWHDWTRDTFRVQYWDNTYGYLAALANDQQ